MNLFLVRHGLSVANIQGLVTGDVNDPLSAVGLADVQKAAPWFQSLKVPFAAAYTSQWQRAQETASNLFHSQVFEVDARLGETQAGEVDNWPLRQFLQSASDFYQDPQRSYPGGESHHQLNERVMAWLERAFAQHAGRNVLAVCHSGPIACLVQQALCIPMERFPALLPAHGSLTVIQYPSESAGLPTGRLQMFSATSTERLAARYSQGKTE